MKLAEVLEELQELTVGERQTLIRHAMELDEPPFSAATEELVEERLAAHRQNPKTSVPLEEMKKRVRFRIAK